MTDKSNYRAVDDAYETKNDPTTEVTGDVADESYATKGDNPVPVQKDTQYVEDPIVPPDSNTDAQLGERFSLCDCLTGAM